MILNAPRQLSDATIHPFSEVAQGQVRLRSLPPGGRGTGRTGCRCPAGAGRHRGRHGLSSV